METVQELQQAAGVRINRANTLRQISRLCYAVGADALPAPASVEFTSEGDPVWLLLHFDDASEAEVWWRWLAEHGDPSPTANPNSRWWRGYRVMVSGGAR